jgi:hypothetical protein
VARPGLALGIVGLREQGVVASVPPPLADLFPLGLAGSPLPRRRPRIEIEIALCPQKPVYKKFRQRSIVERSIVERSIAMKTSPLQQVKSNFGDKAKLVSAVQALATEAMWLDRVNSDRGLAKVSNAKLIKLHAALSRAKEEFGSRDKLVGAVLGLQNRSKDDGYKASLAGYSLPRLLDLHDSLAKHPAKPAASKPAGAKRQTRSKKSKLKAA